MDKNKKVVSKEELKKDHIVVIYYSENIQETYPAGFEKVKKIVCLD